MKKIIKKIILNQSYLRKLAIFYCAENGLFPEVFVRTTSKKIREMMGAPYHLSDSQLNQDLFALIRNKFKPGYFVEVGANNGYELSNSVYLEECYGWNGILIEANPKYIDSLKKRKAIVVNKAVSDQVGYLEFIDAGLYGGITSMLDQTHSTHTESAKKIRVESTNLLNILMENNAPQRIDFISVDVEGGELPIVEQICALKNYRFSSGCIEHNYRIKEYEKMKNLLKNSKYKIVWEGLTCQDLYFVDEMDH
jgi:FkbM family methyltransferase